MANDFEILGTCYQHEVEDFLSYLNNHHEFPASRKESKARAMATSPISTQSLSKCSSGGPPTPMAIAPVFAPGEADSISRFQWPPTLSYTYWTPGNLNTLVFGHPAQNSSSKVFWELLGVGQLKRRSEWVEVSNPPPAMPVTQVNRNPTGGAPGPGDSDGDDTGDEGGNTPSRNPQMPHSLHLNPFENPSDQIATTSSTKIPAKLQFDTKLKLDMIPTWDGNPESLRWWFMKLNSLSKRSDLIFKQLGMLVPTWLTGSADTSYYSQSAETREWMEMDWGTLRMAIGEYYMNWSFLDKQKAQVDKVSYHDPGYGRELPSEYVIHKVELLQFVYNYTDNELINEVMESAPLYWILIIMPHLYQTLEQFLLAVKFHEDALTKLANEVQVPPAKNQYYSRDVPTKSSFNPFWSQRAHVNLVGWSQATSKLQFPKDDSEVFTVLHWFLPESRQFPEFQRNQFWQRGLPNRSNDSGGISNRIQIPLEWFWESPGRNANGIRRNRIMTPKLSVGICRRSIWASSTNNAHSFSNHHCPRHPPRHHHQCPRPRTSVTHNHDSEDDMATPRLQANERPHRSGWRVPRCCGRCGYQTMNDDIVVVRCFWRCYHGEHPPLHSKLTR